MQSMSDFDSCMEEMTNLKEPKKRLLAVERGGRRMFTFKFKVQSSCRSNVLSQVVIPYLSPVQFFLLSHLCAGSALTSRYTAMFSCFLFRVFFC
jgi:hypothetical protein